jgi:hypothetical protein
MPSNPHEERARITRVDGSIVSVAGGSVPFEEIRERIREGELLDVRRSGASDPGSTRLWVIDRRTGQCIYSETRWKSEPWVADIVSAAEALPQAEPVIADQPLAQERSAGTDRERQLPTEEKEHAIEARVGMRLVGDSVSRHLHRQQPRAG